MRIISVTCLHYGSDFLKYALQSVHDAVDEQYVLYTWQGSHGHLTNLECPDKRETLAQLAIEGAGDKLRWIDKTFSNEGEQRGYIHTLVPDADCIIVVDADEIYDPRLIVDIQSAMDNNIMPKRLRLPFWHYWRSFKRGFMHDPAFPERVIFPKSSDTTGTLNTKYVVHHFGYAQRSEIVRYKLETHGHKNEFRRDCDWFTDVFMANRQTDCHPVGSQYWNCEDMDLTQLPSVLSDHPYREMDVIP